MFINKFFINTHFDNLINQKIMNILWNARASVSSNITLGGLSRVKDITSSRPSPFLYLLK